MAKKPKASLSDHIRMAVRVEFMRRTAMSTLCDILQNHATKSSDEYKKMRRVIEDLDSIKSGLDNIVCRDEPDGISHWCTHVYYGIKVFDDHMDCDTTLIDGFLEWLARRHAEYLSEMAGMQIEVTDYDSSHAKYFKDKGLSAEEKKSIDDRMEEYFGYREDEYVLTPDQIRDFCEDAIAAGVTPTDMQIQNVVGEYRVIKDNGVGSPHA